MRRRVFVECALAALLTACQAAPSPSPTPSRPTPSARGPAPSAAATTTPPVSSASTPMVSPSASSSAHDILFVRDDYGVRTPGQIAVVDAMTGQQLRRLPLGLPTSDWSMLYGTTRNDGKTTVQATDPATAKAVRQVTIDGAYDLAGLTPSGSQIVLQYEPSHSEVDAYTKDDHWKSRFLVLAGSLTEKPRQVALDGAFGFDSISRDGTALYLIENLPPTQPTEYRVRWYDLRRDVLQPGAIVDKSESEPMSGFRLSAVPSRDGSWLYSMYVNQTKGPFVHALNLEQRIAICIDLPSVSVDDYEKQLLWALAIAHDGATLYAANGALGYVGAIDLAQLRVVRSANLPIASAPAPTMLAHLMAEVFPTAEAKRLLLGGAALSPDGHRLFVAAEKGLLAVETADLTRRWHALPDRTLDSVAISPDGDRLYVVDAESRLVFALNPATGEGLGTVRGADHPAGILRVAR